MLSRPPVVLAACTLGRKSFCLFFPSQTPLSKQAKFEMMPYTVAMAYAVRVKMDANLAKSYLIPETERANYLRRNGGIAESFTLVLHDAIKGLLYNTGLLKVALDYQQPLAAYVTLMGTLPSSARLMRASSSAPEKIVLWDGGLEAVR